MLRNIKHSLTNPINAILGYSELILEILDSIDNKILKKDISSIHQSGVIILNSLTNIIKTDSDSNKAPIFDNIKNRELQFSLRTPLSTIIGLTDLIIEENKINSKENNQDIYKKDILESSSDNHFSFTIPKEFVTDQYVEYYFLMHLNDDDTLISFPEKNPHDRPISIRINKDEREDSF